MMVSEIKELRQKMGASTRLIGLDHSKTRIGVAMAEVATRIVTPVTVLRGKNFTENIASLAALCKDYGITIFVIGLPLNMDGSEGPRAQSVRHFALNLSRAQDRLGFSPVIAFMDERLSSFAADERLDDINGRARNMQDALAAAVMLEDALTLMHSDTP